VCNGYNTTEWLCIARSDCLPCKNRAKNTTQLHGNPAVGLFIANTMFSLCRPLPCEAQTCDNGQCSGSLASRLEDLAPALPFCGLASVRRCTVTSSVRRGTNKEQTINQWGLQRSFVGYRLVQRRSFDEINHAL
jgi:hypothetical protein